MEYHYHINANIKERINEHELDEMFRNQFGDDLISVESFYDILEPPRTGNIHLLLKRELDTQKVVEMVKKCLSSYVKSIHVSRIEDWEGFIKKYKYNSG